MIAIVTDSSAGYSSNELKKIGVHVVPLSFVYDGKVYEEKNRGENGNFLPMVLSGKAKTSQPPLSAFVDVFTKLKNKGYEVLCILLSGGLSGTFSSACIAAKQVGGVIKVVDSLTTNGGQHLLVDEAVNMVVGNMKLAEIVKNLEFIRDKIGFVFSVDEMDSLVRGGRLGLGKGTNTTLNTRPVFSVSGGITFITNVRGIAARNRALCEAVPDSARRIFVMRSDENDDMTPLIEMLRVKHPTTKIHLREVGPVLAIHVGVGSYGVAFIA